MSGWVCKSIKALEFGLEHLRNTAAIEDLLAMDGNHAFEALRDRVAALDDDGYHAFTLALKTMIDHEQQRLAPYAEGDCHSPSMQVPLRSRDRAAVSRGRLLTLQAFLTYTSHYWRELGAARSTDAAQADAVSGLPLNYA